MKPKLNEDNCLDMVDISTDATDLFIFVIFISAVFSVFISIIFIV